MGFLKNALKAAAVCFALSLVFAAAGQPAYADSDVPEELNGHSIPVVTLTIDPDEFEKVVASEDHSYKSNGGTIRITVPEGYKSEYADELTADTGELDLKYIRGRGNATWLMEKKPFKFRLSDDVENTDLLGMGSNKHWALMSNPMDQSGLRNRLVSYMGSAVGLDYTPQMVPVDFVVNGEYKGMYYLSEVVRIGKSRVNINSIDPEITEGRKLTGGYLLSYKPFESEFEENKFTTKSGESFGTVDPYFATDDPEDAEKVGAVQQKEYISKYLQDVEDLIYADDIDEAGSESNQKLAAMMDLDSTARYWWIQEFTINGDAFETPSTYLYKTRDKDGQTGKLYWGPLWDFDMSTMPGYSGEGFNNTEMPWLDHLRAYDPDYDKVLRENWAKLDGIIEDIIRDGGVIDQYVEETRASCIDDYEMYGYREEGVEPDFEAQFDEMIQEMKNYYSNRRNWINAHIGTSFGSELNDVYSMLTFYVDGKKVFESRIRHAFDWIKPEDFPADPVKSGYVFMGWNTKKDGTGIYMTGENGDFLDEDTALYAQWEKKVTSPKITKAQLTSNSKAAVKWKKVSGAASYTVKYKIRGAKKWKTKTVSGTKAVLKKLKPGKKYLIKVQAVNKAGASKFSKVKKVTTLAKVKKLKASKKGARITLSWKKVSTAKGYQKKVYTSDSKKWKTVKSGTKLGKTKFRTVKFFRGRTYKYKVRAYKTVGGKKIYGPWSAPVKAK